MRLRRNNDRLSRHSLELPEAYYAGSTDEVDENIAENRRPLSELRDLYPFAGFSLTGDTG